MVSFLEGEGWGEMLGQGAVTSTLETVCLPQYFTSWTLALILPTLLFDLWMSGYTANKVISLRWASCPRQGNDEAQIYTPPQCETAEYTYSCHGNQTTGQLGIKCSSRFESYSTKRLGHWRRHKSSSRLPHTITKSGWESLFNSHESIVAYSRHTVTSIISETHKRVYYIIINYIARDYFMHQLLCHTVVECEQHTWWSEGSLCKHRRAACAHDFSFVEDASIVGKGVKFVGQINVL